jgi:S1-C subfamily serine protease
MRCPKCGQIQDESPQCSSCGIYIEKYKKLLEMREDQSPPATSGRRTIFLIAVVGVCTIGLVVALVSGNDDKVDVVATVQASATEDPSTTAMERKEVHPADWHYSNDISAKLSDNLPTRNAVETARLSTVYVNAPWGHGSGFFVSPECHIVTNSHVVALDEEVIDRASERLAADETQLSTAAGRLEQLERSVEAKRAAFLRTCSDCSEDNYRRMVGKSEDKIRELQVQYRDVARSVGERRQQLEDFQYVPYFEIILANGDELEAELIRTSERFDLALLKLTGATCPHLLPADEEGIRHGDPVFALGSPKQTKHVVTAGVLSGYQQARGSRWIQTDAAINPGNSGGPLIDRTGRVLGINTLKLGDAEGIGLAIPFSVARQEFDL